MSERVHASMLSASVGGLCSLLKVQGSEHLRQRSSSPWWLSSRCAAGCCSSCGALAGRSCWVCFTSCPVSALGGNAQQELVPPRPIRLVSLAPLPRLVAVDDAAAAAGAERSGAVVRRGCWRRALLPTMSIWKADVAAEAGRVRGLPVAASACPPHRLNASPHAPSLHLVPHHVGAHAAMWYTCTCTFARACAHAWACTCAYTCSYAGTCPCIYTAHALMHMR